jgi:hypothetical protein
MYYGLQHSSNVKSICFLSDLREYFLVLNLQYSGILIRTIVAAEKIKNCKIIFFSLLEALLLSCLLRAPICASQTSQPRTFFPHLLLTTTWLLRSARAFLARSNSHAATLIRNILCVLCTTCRIGRSFPSICSRMSSQRVSWSSGWHSCFTVGRSRGHISGRGPTIRTVFSVFLSPSRKIPT